MPFGFLTFRKAGKLGRLNNIQDDYPSRRTNRHILGWTYTYNIPVKFQVCQTWEVASWRVASLSVHFQKLFSSLLHPFLLSFWQQQPFSVQLQPPYLPFSLQLLQLFLLSSLLLLLSSFLLPQLSLPSSAWQLPSCPLQLFLFPVLQLTWQTVPLQPF